MSTDATGPFSVYRGQADSGIGEGPGRPILRGEQYLAADDPLHDADLLAAIRPWLTLDSDPADLRQLRDRLEAWSSFPEGPWRFVACLRPGGIYDVRASYFAHGRAWRAEALTGGFDPGVYLGRPTAFDRPWRDASTRPTDPGLPSASALPWAAVAAEPAVAARLLAHLLQARHAQGALVVAVPVEDFAAEGTLAELIAFARAALPLRLKEGCRVRVYTRLPELFLRHLRADLVVVPEELGREALIARRDATLLDRTGEHRGGPELDPRALAWAEAVVGRVRTLPEGLLAFSERAGRSAVAQRLPGEDEVRTVQVSYNLGYALAGPPERRQGLLRDFLLPKAQELGVLSWRELVAPEEWGAFSRDELFDIFLRPPQELSSGGQALQATIAESAPQKCSWADEDAWISFVRDHSPEEVARHRPRFLQLLAEGYPTIPLRLGVELGRGRSLEQLGQEGPVSGILRAELEAGELSPRGGEASTLARLAAEDPQVLEVAVRATSRGALDNAWVFSFLGAAGDRGFFELATRLLAAPADWGRFDRVLKGLLDRLRSSPSPPRELREQATHAGELIDPVSQFGIFVRLVDLVAHLDEIFGVNDPNPLPARLREALPRLRRPEDRRFLIQLVGGAAWPSLEPSLLISADRAPTVPWALEEASSFLASAPLRQRLSPEALLLLAQPCLEGMKDGQLGAIYEALDALFRENPVATTEALIAANWWSAWRQRAELPREEASTAALAWLGSRVWQRPRSPEAPLEAWERTLADLKGVELSAHELAWLGEGAPGWGWPWIPPYEERQVSALRELPKETLWHVAGELLRNGVRPSGFPERDWRELRLEFRDRLPQGPPREQESTRGIARSLVARVAEALFAARSADPCWGELAEQVQLFGGGAGKAPAQAHPLFALERAVRQNGASLRAGTSEGPLETLSQVLEENPCLVGLARRVAREEPIVPLFNVVAALCGPGALGHAGWWIVARAHDAQLLQEGAWWGSLFRSVETYRRHGDVRSVDDRCDVAIALLGVAIEKLPQAEQEVGLAMHPIWKLKRRPVANRPVGVTS